MYHGGGARCSHENGCSKGAVGGLFCIRHGGGRRCLFDGCDKPTFRQSDYCRQHDADGKYQASNGDAEGKEKTVTVSKDEGPRAGTTMEGLAKLKPAFDKKGSTTAGNASQTSDGAAAVLLMRRSEAQKRGLPILGVFRGYKVKGVLPDEMGVGPAVAIPALLQDVQIGVNDVEVYEINEAFASQAVYCVKKLGIKTEKVNPNGGAIALGHPLGATGARQVATLLNELQRRKAAQKGNKPLTGVVSMCIGTGMGAAGIFEV